VFPSGHAVFATIVGVALLRHGGAVIRSIGVAYPLTVIAVTLATDNHFVADAIGGLLVVAIAVEVTRGWARLETVRTPVVRIGRTPVLRRLVGNDSRSR
jgi:membrane-associated phospholipid phosphatase